MEEACTVVAARSTATDHLAADPEILIPFCPLTGLWSPDQVCGTYLYLKTCDIHLV